MKKELKTAVIEDLNQKLDGASAFYLTDFTGMNVKQITEFRSRLRKQGVEYVVVKNTLAQRALTGMELPDIAAFFSGPTGLVIGREDAVGAAKVLTDFAKEFGDRPAIKVGVVDGKAFDADQVRKLADMPPREVLLAQIAGGLQAPMARLAGGMSQLLAGFARAVDALRQQREGAGS
jgi:large subunit ribosomal protein L10